MADYFTRFSCTLDVGSPENAIKALAIYRAYADELDGEDLSIGFAAETGSDAGATTIRMHDDGGGDVEHVIAFAQRCGQALGLSGHWGFQYANTCSRPRLDGFGGGAHVLDLATGQTVGWTDTDGWLAATIAGVGDG